MDNKTDNTFKNVAMTCLILMTCCLIELTVISFVYYHKTVKAQEKAEAALQEYLDTLSRSSSYYSY